VRHGSKLRLKLCCSCGVSQEDMIEISEDIVWVVGVLCAIHKHLPTLSTFIAVFFIGIQGEAFGGHRKADGRKKIPDGQLRFMAMDHMTIAIVQMDIFSGSRSISTVFFLFMCQSGRKQKARFL